MLFGRCAQLMPYWGSLQDSNVFDPFASRRIYASNPTHIQKAKGITLRTGRCSGEGPVPRGEPTRGSIERRTSILLLLKPVSKAPAGCARGERAPPNHPTFSPGPWTSARLKARFEVAAEVTRLTLPGKSGMIREPPYVGCYFFNSLPGVWCLGFGHALELGVWDLEL